VKQITQSINPALYRFIADASVIFPKSLTASPNDQVADDVDIPNRFDFEKLHQVTDHLFHEINYKRRQSIHQVFILVSF
jgi:hypothetical protein